jgi:hypothetical protein
LDRVVEMEKVAYNSLEAPVLGMENGAFVAVRWKLSEKKQ